MVSTAIPAQYLVLYRGAISIFKAACIKEEAFMEVRMFKEN